MTNNAIETPYSGAWTGYLIVWGQPVPENPQVAFHKGANYNIGPVSRASLEFGEIMAVKKTDVGLYVLIKTELIPENYEWTYTVGTPEFEFKLNPQTGTSQQVLKSYPLLSISYAKAESADVQATPHSAVRRPKRSAGTAYNEPVPGTDS